jgi:DNA-binding ferritin-like protein
MDAKLNKLVQALLGLAAKSHFWHLTTSSYAEHIAFGDLYGYAHELVDSITEPARHAYNYEPCTCSMALALTSTDKAIADITAVIRLLDTCRDQPWLTALIDDGQAQLHQYIYKLKFLS